MSLPPPSFRLLSDSRSPPGEESHILAHSWAPNQDLLAILFKSQRLTVCRPLSSLAEGESSGNDGNVGAESTATGNGDSSQGGEGAADAGGTSGSSVLMEEQLVDYTNSNGKMEYFNDRISEEICAEFRVLGRRFEVQVIMGGLSNLVHATILLSIFNTESNGPYYRSFNLRNLTDFNFQILTEFKRNIGLESANMNGRRTELRSGS